MNRYLKLLHMEVHRFRYVLAGLMALTAVIEIVVLIMTILKEIAAREQAALQNTPIGWGAAIAPRRGPVSAREYDFIDYGLFKAPVLRYR